MTAAVLRPRDAGMTGVEGPTNALYEGVVRHRRFGPVPHESASPIVMTLLDIDELAAIDDLPLWSRRVPLVRHPARSHQSGARHD